LPQLSDTALGMAGGLILFLIALRMVFPHAAGIFDESQEQETVIVPLAIPAIAGPSALSPENGELALVVPAAASLRQYNFRR
jgi:small neutral amino acid transporter SnatA (MarC family)